VVIVIALRNRYIYTLTKLFFVQAVVAFSIYVCVAGDVWVWLESSGWRNVCRMDTKEAATKAIIATHGTQINGYTCKCSWGKETESSSGSQNRPATQQNSAYPPAPPASSICILKSYTGWPLLQTMGAVRTLEMGYGEVRHLLKSQGSVDNSIRHPCSLKTCCIIWGHLLTANISEYDETYVSYRWREKYLN